MKNRNKKSKYNVEQPIEEMTENFDNDYRGKKPLKNSNLIAIIYIVILGFLTFMAISITTLNKTTQFFEEEYTKYNEINDSYNDFLKYSHLDLERTATTTYPVLIKDFPETQNFAKYCLPCTPIFQSLEIIFYEKMTERKKKNASHIPLQETDLYLNLASKTNDLIDNYQVPVYPSAFDILQKPSVTDYKLSMRILKSWLWASMYYASQNKTSEALLLAYAPLLVCQDIETNTADGADMDTKKSQVQIEACEQLLYLINYFKIDSNLTKKISINLIKIVNSEPSFVRQIENFMRCDKNYYSYLEKENNAFAKYILKSEMHKEWYNKIFNDAKEQIRQLEKTANYSKFTSWQIDLFSKIIEPNQNKGKKTKVVIPNLDPYKIFRDKELTLCRKALTNQVPFFGYYYFINLEKIAIMKGTAVALAFKAFEAEKKKRPISEQELNQWLGINIPKDPISNQSYSPSYRSDFILNGTTINKNKSYNPVYIKNILPLLVNGDRR